MCVILKRWSQGEFGSYLLDITADVLIKPDSFGDGYLADKILDVARQKGTGMWATREATEIEAPTLTIDAAISMRALSADRSQRARTGRP